MLSMTTSVVSFLKIPRFVNVCSPQALFELYAFEAEEFVNFIPYKGVP